MANLNSRDTFAVVMLSAASFAPGLREAFAQPPPPESAPPSVTIPMVPGSGLVAIQALRPDNQITATNFTPQAVLDFKFQQEKFSSGVGDLLNALRDLYTPEQDHDSASTLAGVASRRVEQALAAMKPQLSGFSEGFDKISAPKDRDLQSWRIYLERLSAVTNEVLPLGSAMLPHSLPQNWEDTRTRLSDCSGRARLASNDSREIVLQSVAPLGLKNTLELFFADRSTIEIALRGALDRIDSDLKVLHEWEAGQATIAQVWGKLSLSARQEILFILVAEKFDSPGPLSEPLKFSAAVAQELRLGNLQGIAEIVDSLTSMDPVTADRALQSMRLSKTNDPRCPAGKISDFKCEGIPGESPSKKY